MGQFIGSYKPDGYNTEEEIEMFRKEKDAQDFATFLEENSTEGCGLTECMSCRRRREYPLRGVKDSLASLSAKKKREANIYDALNEILRDRKRIYPWNIKYEFIESDEPLGLYPQYALFEQQEADKWIQISNWFLRLEHLVHWGKAVRPLFGQLYDFEDWMAKNFGDSTVVAHDGELALEWLTQEIRTNIKNSSYKTAAKKLNILYYVRFTAAREAGSMLASWADEMDNLREGYNRTSVHVRDAAAYLNTYRREKLDVKADASLLTG